MRGQRGLAALEVVLALDVHELGEPFRRSGGRLDVVDEPGDRLERPARRRERVACGPRRGRKRRDGLVARGKVQRSIG